MSYQILVAVIAACSMIFLRTAVQPIIGSDVSFVALFPAVIVATLAGGPFTGGITIIVGSVIALLFSAEGHIAAHPDAIPRLVVWLISSSIAVAVSLELRRTFVVLKSHEAQLVETGERLRFVVNELEHRGRNALALVDALSRDTARTAKSVKEYRDTLSSKMGALAGAYSFVTRPDCEPALLGSLIRDTLNFFWNRIDEAEGPVCWAPRQTCVPLALVLHELATNAAKYGALSDDKGRVQIQWRLLGGGKVRLIWQEIGGPAPTAPTRRGFGSELVERAFSQVPGANFESRTESTGMLCLIDFESEPASRSIITPAPLDSAEVRKSA